MACLVIDVLGEANVLAEGIEILKKQKPKNCLVTWLMTQPDYINLDTTAILVKTGFFPLPKFLNNF